MGTNLFKGQFSGGEIAPALYARVESGAYQTGAKKLRNFFVRPQGSIVNRPGTEYIGNCLYDPEVPQVRLIPFQFSQGDAYVLEFTHRKMRVIRNGGYVLDTENSGNTRILYERNIHYIETQEDPIIRTLFAHGLSAGMHIQLLGMARLQSLNNRFFVVSEIITDRSFTVSNFDGFPLDTSELGQYAPVKMMIAGISKSSPATVTLTKPHGLDSGDLKAIISFVDVGGMGEINNNRYRIRAVPSPTTITLSQLAKDTSTPIDSTGYLPLDSTGYSTYTSGGFFYVNSTGGRVRRIFQKSMPYEGGELSRITYDQSADVMTLCHPNHVQLFLTRQDHSVWRSDYAVFEPSIEPPINLTGSSSHYVTTTIDALTTSNPAIISLDNAQVAFSKGSAGFIRDVGGIQQFRDRVIILGDVASEANKSYEVQNTSLEGINSSSYTTYTSGGTLEGDTLYRYVVTSIDAKGTESRPSSAFLIACKAMSSLTDAGTPFPKVMLDWLAVDGAVSYNIYRQREVSSGQPAIGSLYGYLGNSTTPQFVDQNTTPDFTITPPAGYNPFLTTVITVDIYRIFKESPVRIETPTAHGLVVGDTVRLKEIVGMTQINNVLGVVHTVPTSTTFTLVRQSDDSIIDATDYGAYQSNISGITQANPAVFTATNNYSNGAVVQIDSVVGMTQVNGTIGIVKNRTPTTFQLQNITTRKMVNSTDYTAYSSGGVVRGAKGFAERRNPLNKPYATCYYQQRKVYGGSNENPQTVWMTQSGTRNNMDKSIPIKDSDSIEFQLDSSEINTIKHLVPLSKLLVFTEGGLFKVGGDNGAVTPSDPSASPQDNTGANDVKPLVLSNDVLYVGQDGSSVNSTSYTILNESYKADDISVRAKHLIEQSPIKEWARATSPNNLVVAVREDGILLFLTYLKEAQVVAWTWGDTGSDGEVDAFESVCSIREDGEDVVYLVARRYICTDNGCSFQRFTERMHSRNLYKVGGQAKPENMLFLDSAVKYNGVGNPLGASVTEITTLHHLEGRTVSIVADGNVLAKQVVTGGKVSFARSAVVVTVGLSYISELETLPLDVGNGSISVKKKTINKITARLADTRGLEISIDGRDYVKAREAPIVALRELPLHTGDLYYQMKPNASRDGFMYVRQIEPLPCEILGLIPDVSVTENNS